MGHRGSLPWPMACEYRVCCKPDCQGALRIIKDDAESLVVEIHPDRCLLWYEPLLWLGSFKTVVLCKGIPVTRAFYPFLRAVLCLLELRAYTVHV